MTEPDPVRRSRSGSDPPDFRFERLLNRPHPACVVTLNLSDLDGAVSEKLGDAVERRPPSVEGTPRTCRGTGGDDNRAPEEWIATLGHPSCLLLRSAKHRLILSPRGRRPDHPQSEFAKALVEVVASEHASRASDKQLGIGVIQPGTVKSAQRT